MAGDAQVTMYSTRWCGYCTRLKAQMDRESIAYEVVDIEQHPEAARLVEQHNHGNQTVPTLVYSDGTAHTNPPAKTVMAKAPMMEHPDMTAEAMQTNSAWGKFGGMGK